MGNKRAAIVLQTSTVFPMNWVHSGHGRVRVRGREPAAGGVVNQAFYRLLGRRRCSSTMQWQTPRPPALLFHSSPACRFKVLGQFQFGCWMDTKPRLEVRITSRRSPGRAALCHFHLSGQVPRKSTLPRHGGRARAEVARASAAPDPGRSLSRSSGLLIWSRMMRWLRSFRAVGRPHPR